MTVNSWTLSITVHLQGTCKTLVTYTVESQMHCYYLTLQKTAGNAEIINPSLCF